MARIAVLLLSAVYCLVFAGVTDDLLEMVKSRTEAIYCGSTLSDVLSLVCQGRYRAPETNRDRRRRSSRDIELNTLEDDVYFPFLSESIMENFASTYGNHRRLPRGVYNECCQRACSYDVLKSYCAD